MGFEDLPEDIRLLLDSVTSPEEILERLQVRRDTFIRLSDMREDLTKEHPNKWAALHADDLVVAESLTELLEKCDERGYDRDSIATRFLTTEERVRVL
ncbi:MAG: hypothetical protein F4X27_16535 [Chloroflexi bacterium]|nr:hypothetical protein [Chloroflexota bacterium]